MEDNLQHVNLLPAVMTLASGMLGSAIVSLPLVFASMGVLCATLVLIVTAIVSGYTLHVYGISAVKLRDVGLLQANEISFGHLIRIVLGPGYLPLASIAVAFACTCVMIAHMVIVADILEEVADMNFAEAWYSTRLFILVCYSAIIIFPLTLYTHISSLRAPASIAVVALVCVTAMIVVSGLTEADVHASDSDFIWTINSHHVLSTIAKLPILIFGFAVHPSFLHILAELSPTQQRTVTRSVIAPAVLLATVIFWCIGVCGYLYAGVDALHTGNILLSFNLRQWPIALACILFCTSLSLSVPVILYPAQRAIHSLWHVISKTSEQHDEQEHFFSSWTIILQNSLILLFGVCIAAFVPDVSFVFELVGSTGAICIVFVVPGLLLKRLDGYTDADLTSALLRPVGEPLPSVTTSSAWCRAGCIGTWLMIGSIIVGVVCISVNVGLLI